MLKLFKNLYSTMIQIIHYFFFFVIIFISIFLKIIEHKLCHFWKICSSFTFSLLWCFKNKRLLNYRNVLLILHMHWDWFYLSNTSILIHWLFFLNWCCIILLFLFRLILWIKNFQAVFIKFILEIISKNVISSFPWKVVTT